MTAVDSIKDGERSKFWGSGHNKVNYNSVKMRFTIIHILLNLNINVSQKWRQIVIT